MIELARMLTDPHKSIYVCVGMCVCVCVCACVCVCVQRLGRNRGKKAILTNTELINRHVCVRAAPVCECMRDKECVCEGEREKECVCARTCMRREPRRQ